MPGKFINDGARMASNYEPTAAALPGLMTDFYGHLMKIGKSAGFAGYGSQDGNGLFNAIMGKEITAGMFASDNLMTALGARAYNHEGQRIAYELASFVDGTYQFPGYDTVQDGAIPDGVQMPIESVREPYKDLPFPFNYGMGLMALEDKDDTIAYKDYIDMMGKQYTDGLDKSICRPMSSDKIVMTKKGLTGTEKEVTLEALARVNSSYAEFLDVADGKKVSPYGGDASDLRQYRGNKASNFDAQYVNNKDESMTSDAKFRELYRLCSGNWADGANPNNKFWAMSPMAQEKLAGLMATKNMFMDSVYVQRDFNGVKTMPGRDAGMLLSAFLNAPIIQEGNLAYDYTNGRISATDMGEVHLVDADHSWLSVLTPVQLFTADNVAYNRALQVKHVLHMRAELRSDRWIGSGRLVHIA